MKTPAASTTLPTQRLTSGDIFASIGSFIKSDLFVSGVLSPQPGPANSQFIVAKQRLASNMENSPILKVAVLADGRTAVFPQSKRGDYQYVYREAAGVYWDHAMGCFVSTSPHEWTPQKWYQHIISVVRTGVGLQMVLTADTEYESMDEGFGASIKLADQDLWR